MATNNIHVLSEDEVEMLNNMFKHELKDDQILQTPVKFKRTTAYPVDRSFSVVYTYFNRKRKITIQAYTIKVWIDNFKDKYTLFEVQNAINKLLITYQTPNVVDIKEKLSNPDSIKIRIV